MLQPIETFSISKQSTINIYKIADALEVSLDWLFGRNIAQNAAKTERE